MSRKRPGLLCQKEVCDLLGICRRTLLRFRAQWGLVPVEIDGNALLFTRDDVERANNRRLAAKLPR